MKFFYNILKVDNYQFASYYIYHKEIFEIIILTQNHYFFYKSSSLGIIEIQINNILILINNNFTCNHKEVIRVIKIMIKN